MSRFSGQRKHQSIFVPSSTSSALSTVFSLKLMLSASCSVCTCGRVHRMHVPVWGYTFIFKSWKFHGGASPHCSMVSMPLSIHTYLSWLAVCVQICASQGNEWCCKHSCNSRVGSKKWWSCALLSLKCCCFMWKPMWEGHASPSEDKEKIWWLLFRYLHMSFHTTRSLFGDENTQRWMDIVIKAYKFIMWVFFYYYIPCPCYPYI